MGFLLTDLEGLDVSAEEREIIAHPTVTGIILFSRNYESPTQLRALTHAILQADKNVFIAVDQEGGRVQRFRQGFSELAAMRQFGEHYQHNANAAIQSLKQAIQQSAEELLAHGVNVNLAPVLDVDHGVSDIIGARSFASDPEQVAVLAQQVIETLHQQHMPAVGKHFPGHGAVVADSHQALPVDQRDQDALLESDLVPFARLAKSLDAIMPAHVVYEAFDALPATFSRYWLQEVLRRQLRFNGIVISDDLSMEGAAVMGDHVDRAKQALAAGCDIITACNNRQGAVSIIDALANHRHAKSQARIRYFTENLPFHSTASD